MSQPSADVPSLSNSFALDMRGAVALLRLTRPEKRNALDDTTIAGIEAFFAQPPAGAGAVVLRAEGAHFYAGLDLSTITETDVVGGITPPRAWHLAIERIENRGMPVIAVLHGAVVGGGLELAAAAISDSLSGRRTMHCPKGGMGFSWEAEVRCGCRVSLVSRA